MNKNSDPPGRRNVAAFALGAAATAVVLAVVVLGYAVVTRDDGNDTDSAPSTPATTITVSGPGAPATATDLPLTTTPGGAVPNTFAYQPLWPFADAAGAAAWQQSYREGGHQPWHLDPAATALGFARDYLGYANIDRVVQVQTKGEEAWVTVGYDDPAEPGGDAFPAAKLHLVRLGAGDDAPWEIVGTDDTTLTLTTPKYGARITSPVTVGGRITGVDESLDIQIRQLAQQAPIGTTGMIPAGGTDTPWTGTVNFSASCPGTLTVAVATGGHIEEVERFAVTGVRC
ncbi:hypothetical protein [Nocardia sp. NPDC127526]|uniref:hypothetical protein n=1 Tax=Nocardia sp. NPDC127526 TaxID=3345393 RepID=UPI00363443F7